MPLSDQHSVKVMPKALVCEDSTLQGDITILPGCVVHPTASIIAEAGPIVLGENCIVEEYAIIAHRQLLNAEAPTLHIGANNVFEVGCVVEASLIGEKNVFESKCYVGPKVSISNGCVVGAGVRLICEQHVQENTVIFGRHCQQRESTQLHGSQTLQIDFLRKVLPNYHHLRKPNHDPKKAHSGI